MWVGLCLGFLYMGRYQPLLEVLPSCLRPQVEDSDGSISVLVYYFQLAAIAVPVGKQKIAQSAAHFLCVMGQAVNMQHAPDFMECSPEDGGGSGGGGGGGGACVVVGTSATAAMAWQLGIPVVLALLLLSIDGLWRLVSGLCGRRAGNVRTAADGDVDDDTAGWQEPLLPNHSSGAGAFGSCNSSVLTLSSLSAKSEAEADGGIGQADAATTTTAPLPAASAAKAGVQMLLFSYGSFSAVVFRLLHCVPVCNLAPAGQFTGNAAECTVATSVLFYAGEVKCGSWQWPYWLLLLIVFVVPAAPTLLWIVRRVLPSSWYAGRWAASVRCPYWMRPMQIFTAMAFR
jgi:hypothetical protein